MFKQSIKIFITFFIGTFLVLSFGVRVSNGLVNIFSSESTLQDVLANTYLFPLSEDRITQVQQAQIYQASNTDTQTNSTLLFRINMPSLGKSAPIITENSADINTIYKTLKRGVVHYGASPTLGEKGTSILLGHSSSPPWSRGSYDTIFDSLDKLKNGDKINIISNGQALNYEVKYATLLSPFSNDSSVIERLEKTNDSSLILVSCWPAGANSQRIAVRADLVN
jgi:LPXTG-site transpeptidase (sortase) family protein